MLNVSDLLSLKVSLFYYDLCRNPPGFRPRKTFDGFDCKDNTEEEGHLGVKARINHKSERYRVTSYSTRRFLRPEKSTLVIRVMLFLSRSLEREKRGRRS